MNSPRTEHSLDAHLFICTHHREKGESCAAKGSAELRDRLKQDFKEHPLPENHKIRINASGCLGHCKDGITAVLYPQGIWMTHLTSQDDRKVREVVEIELSRQNSHKKS